MDLKKLQAEYLAKEREIIPNFLTMTVMPIVVNCSVFLSES